MKHWRISLANDPGAKVEFDCAQGMTIHAAARDAGYRVRASCKSGGCGICAATLRSGSVDYVSPVSKAKLEGCPPATVFLCQATPTQDCCFSTDWQWSVIDKTPLSRRMATAGKANKEE